jgi:hypothetical protein
MAASHCWTGRLPDLTQTLLVNKSASAHRCARGRRRAPRLHGELLKLGIDIAQSTVAKYMSQRRGPRSPDWQVFLRNHTAHIAGIDLFVVPTIGFKRPAQTVGLIASVTWLGGLHRHYVRMA